MEMTFIKDSVDGNILASAITTKILSCTDLRPFWVAWGNRQLSVGRGMYPDNMIIATSGQLEHFVHGLALKSDGSAVWHTYKSPGILYRWLLNIH